MIESNSRWIIGSNEEAVSEVDLPISNVVKQLLMKRGITNSIEAKKFLSPNLEDLHDPFLFPDMGKVVERIEMAILNYERVLVYGDYDADGVTSTALLVEVLRDKGAVVDFYIPNRFTEGYGPNENAFRLAKESGVTLIITVDNGIAAVHEAKVAKELGIDLIITDHHEAQEELPDAYAIIHPKLADEYPFNELAGVGVAFKLAHALLGELPIQLLELAAIGTIADLVLLKDENRIMVHYGLLAIENTQRPGLMILKELAGISGSVTEEHIGFGIGPRLNAVGRLQDARPAADLLLEEDPEIAEELANEIQALNQERQKIVNDITKEAIELIEQDQLNQFPILVVAKENWNSGVVGIVASKLVNKYNKPTIVLGIDPEKGIAKGSARSIDAFSLFDNCMEIKDIFISFGGHAQAAGMTLLIENINELRTKLSELANMKLTKEDFVPITNIDLSVNLFDLNIDMIKEVQKLAPFGMGNPKPLFHIEKVVPKEVRQIGSNLNHLKMSFQKDDIVLDVVGFGKGEILEQLSPKSPISIVGELEINEWNGRQKMQLMLKDLKVDEWQLFDLRGSTHSVKQLVKLNNSVVAVHFGTLKSDESWIEESLQCYLVKDEGSLTEIDPSYFQEILLVDIPKNLDQLTTFLTRVSPKKVYAYFRMDEANYFGQIPTREHFKQFYGVMMKIQKLNIKTDRIRLAKSKGWPIQFLDFMIKVFLELEFVRMDNGEIIYNINPKKQDLTMSKTYQMKKHQIITEKTLYYSSYDELKNWFDNHLDTSNIEEAQIHGF